MSPASRTTSCTPRTALWAATDVRRHGAPVGEAGDHVSTRPEPLSWAGQHGRAGRVTTTLPAFASLSPRRRGARRSRTVATEDPVGPLVQVIVVCGLRRPGMPTPC